MAEHLKAPTISACSGASLHSILRLWRIYLHKATNNSLSKEIGDWHNFQRTAGIRQSSKVSNKKSDEIHIPVTECLENISLKHYGSKGR